MIDAAELARLRDKAARPDACDWCDCPDTILALIDELEKARGDRDAIASRQQEDAESWRQVRAYVVKAEAERDSARALLREVKGWLERRGYDTARIAKEIGE